MPCKFVKFQVLYFCQFSVNRINCKPSYSEDSRNTSHLAVDGNVETCAITEKRRTILGGVWSLTEHTT